MSEEECGGCGHKRDNHIRNGVCFHLDYAKNMGAAYCECRGYTDSFESIVKKARVCE